MRCLEAEGNRLLIYRRKSIAGSNPAAYDMVEPVRFRPAQIKFESKIFWTSYFLSETCWKQFQINIDADVPTLKLYGQWNQLGWLLDELTAYATIAQLVERRTCNADVVGSSPTCSFRVYSVQIR